MQAASGMDTDSGSSGKQSTSQAADYGVLPEVEAYAFLLVIIFQIDRRHFAEVGATPLVAQPPAGHFGKFIINITVEGSSCQDPTTSICRQKRHPQLQFSG